MSKGKRWTELDVATSVNQFRMQQDLSRGLSFATIAGYGANAALPHYRPTVTTSQMIETSSTLVLDSGGQYFGELCTVYQIQCTALVLAVVIPAQ
ncbi:hypothetical protein PR048_029565 [Dryococelus australis]|uniref:Peptidase M24 domain-containing protein n=1 Tax=Dryococelus australis TaxID=614101 RepID=A0ABQ9GEE0_9NEOP|nr:hypothetical protein PR048_029565 [Dryococelus australis]